MKFESFDVYNAPLNGTNLIEASAGTGKTYTIAGLYLRLILEKRFTVDQILVVTFTKAATEELKQRIRTRLIEARQAFMQGSSDDAQLAKLVLADPYPQTSIARIADAIRDFDACSIFTIHGFCQRILHENAFETGSLFDTELVTEQNDLLLPVCEDYWRRALYDAPPEFTRYALQKLKGPEAFYQLLNKSKDPDLRVIPTLERPSMPSLEAFRDRCRIVEKAWPIARKDVQTLLMDPALNGTAYGSFKADPEHPAKTRREASVHRLMISMDAFCEHVVLQFPLFKEFDKFRTTFIAKKTNKGKATPTHAFFDECEALGVLGDNLLLEARARLLYVKTHLFSFAGKRLPLLKKKKNIQHYDDLLTLTRDALSKPGADLLAAAVKRRFRAALVDEFQDTDTLQYTIFSRLFSGRGSLFFIIGDPKQAIYGFRGADIFSYMRAASRSDRRYTLKTNYRSRARLIAAVNALFSNVAKPFVFSEIPFVEGRAAADDGEEHESAGPPFEIWFAGSTGGKPLNKRDAETIISSTVANAIRNLITGPEKIDPNDIAVLVRTNLQAQIVKQDLSLNQVPAVIYSAGNVFATREARDLFLLLASIAQPLDQGRFHAALATSIMGVPLAKLDLLGEDVWQEPFLIRFAGYHQTWQRHGFVQMFNQLMAREHIRDRLLRIDDGERRLTNLLHLAELLHASAVRGGLGIQALLKWFTVQRDPSSGTPDTHQLRLESDALSVKIVTIHKSKGLEFPIVFCPFAWGASVVRGEGFTFHDRDCDQRLTLDLGSLKIEENRVLAELEQLAENLRLLYVALTRAREKCFLFWGRINTAETSALAYLLHYREEEGDTASEDNLLQEIRFQYRSKDEAALMQDLKALETASGCSIRARVLPKALPHVSPDHTEVSLEGPARATELSVRKLATRVKRDWHVYSYSSLMASRPATASEADGPVAVREVFHQSSILENQDESDQPDRDATSHTDRSGDEYRQDQDDNRSGGHTIFTFAKGAHAGIFFHDLFEHMDFSTWKDKDLAAYVAEKCKAYGIASMWQDTVQQMLENVITTPLEIGAEVFSLSMLAKHQRINEMEFYFPLRKISVERLQETFSVHSSANQHSGWPEQIGRLQFAPARGFMKGYIDMVFSVNGRYYIVDWKSNHLGYAADDYSRDRLNTVMQRSFYTLQYHIYALALHLFLRLRLPDYRYAQHFGGVFYLFIRGIDPATGPGCGVYFDRPDEALMGALENTMLPEDGAP